MRFSNTMAVYGPGIRTKEPDGKSGHGYYITPHGIVAYVFGFTESGPFTYFQFVQHGRVHTRHWPKIIGEGQLGREIRLYVDEMVELTRWPKVGA